MPSNYQRLILELHVADVNPAGVEACMRLEHGTLDHLPRSKFAEEAALAVAMEREQPGVLRQIAASYGMADEFDHWENLRTVRELR